MASETGVELRPAHLRALLSLAEARHLARFLAEERGPDFLWPGFDLTAIPFVVYRGARDTLLLQHPKPPDEFRRLSLPIPGLEDTVLCYHRGSLPYLPAVGPVDVAGEATAALPIAVFGPRAASEFLVATVVHEAFHAYQAGAGRPAVDLSLVSSYPELSATNNALGNLEGLVLHEFLIGRLPVLTGTADDADPRVGDPAELAATDASRAARRFSLVRRERRGPLEDDIIAYERGLESTEGLARYLQVKCLLGAWPGKGKGVGTRPYQPSRAFETLSGRDVYARAPELIAEQLEKLRGVNVNGAGAAWWRFFHTGLAAGLFADYLDPAWKAKVAGGRPLDAVIEQHVEYDGGAGDEREIEILKQRYGYDQRLNDEREFSREEGRRKDVLLATVLQGTGTRLTFDVSALVPEETWWDSGRVRMVWDPGSVETVTRNVRIHRRGLRFSGYGTDLRFGELPVIEDLKNRLFHVSVTTGGLDVEGDGRRHPADQPAAFDEGLEVLLPGVAARARSGYVQNTGEALYIKITR